MSLTFSFAHRYQLCAYLMRQTGADLIASSAEGVLLFPTAESTNTSPFRITSYE